MIKIEKHLQKPCFKNYNFVDTPRFMARSLSNLFNDLAEGIHKIKCKHGHDKKNAKRVELNTEILSADLNIQTSKMT